MRIELEKDLKNSVGDYFHTGVNAALSLFPFGGTISEFFNILFTPPLEKRRDAWLLKLYDAISQIQAQIDSFSIEELSKNDQFISIMMQSAQLVLKNHQAEKLDALRNAVLNTALDINFDETEQFIFLNMIDNLSVWHLKILYYFKDPTQWFIENKMTRPNLSNCSPRVGLTAAYQELIGKAEFINMVIRDLYNDGLFSDNNINSMSSHGIFDSRVTAFANKFLSYISTPSQLQSDKCNIEDVFIIALAQQ